MASTNQNHKGLSDRTVRRYLTQAMLRKPSPFSALLVTLALAGSAGAQATAPPQATPVAPTAPATEAVVPPMPDVKDPMLEPVPPAPTVLSTWREAIRHIHARSTQLRSAKAKVLQAEGASRSALAPTLPRLTTTGNATHNFTLPDPNSFGLPANQFLGALDLKQILFNMSAWNNVGTLKELEQAAALGEKDIERKLIAAVATAAAEVITNERIAESSRVSLASTLSASNLTRRRAALGAANSLDVLRIEQDVSNARAQIVAGDETLRQAREKLGAALGYTGQWGIAPTIRVEDLVRTATQICKPIQSIEYRADVRSAAKSLDAAKNDRKTADYSFLPTVEANAQGGYFSFAFRSPSLAHWAFFAGATATWPIFDGGDRYGQRRQKEAAETTARETLTQTKRDAELETIRAERAILVARSRLEVSTKTRDIAKEQARLSQIAFMNGSGTSLELVDSTSKLRAAEIDLLVKEFGVFQAELAAFLAKAECSI
jgi:outer membrane protein TolC